MWTSVTIKEWIVPIGQSAARDMQLIGGGKISIGHDTATPNLT